jgi:outer membrane protein assembly factor BamB
MWRFDAGRTAASPDDLPKELDLKWVRHYTPRVMAWEEPLNVKRMPYDKVFEPVVLGNTMFVGFSDSDKIVAIDTGTGEEKWAFYTDGPIRFPPVAYRSSVPSSDRILCVSDDGYLYCLDAARGELQYKFRGGPSDRRILGNKRLISTWPARGGPVIQDGIVYFAASIWPMMGTFIYALEVETGKVIWKNDSTSANWIMQPHHNPAFAGVAPQGAFAVSDGRLLVPGGRSVPACFDLRTGEYLYYRLDEGKPNNYGKTGGSFVCAAGGVFFNHHRNETTAMYDLDSGYQLVAGAGRYPALTQATFFASGRSVAAFDLDRVREAPKSWRDARLWQLDVDASGDLIKVGGRLYAAGDGHVTAIDLPKANGNPEKGSELAWIMDVEGKVERLLAADDKLFAVTLDGRILAFGAESKNHKEFKRPSVPSELPEQAAAMAKAIIEKSGVTEGYALFYGVSDGELLEALTLNSNLAIIGLDRNAKRTDSVRRHLDAQGLYGTRVALLDDASPSFELPPYMASLTVIGDLDAAGFETTAEFLARVFEPMRPYGGKAWIPLQGSERDEFLHLVETGALPGAKAVAEEGGVLLSREGPLPGSAPWTHQYGDAANTVKSDDARVKMPLGVLWFGGNSNTDVLPRHGHGPSAQIIGGRLFVEGLDVLSARDVYTGRVIWKAPLDDLGTFGVYYDSSYATNQLHIPGANARGTNFVATLDKVYVIHGRSCLVLDSVTGKRVRTIALPGAQDGEAPEWGYIGVYKDTLIAGSSFAAYSRIATEETVDSEGKEKDLRFLNFDKTASRQLVAMDRHTGAVRWRVDARRGFLHNGIAVAHDTVFCLDKLPPYTEQLLKRRGEETRNSYRLLALDIHTGKTRWSKRKDVFGSWLSYSEDHDVLLQATRPSGDMVRGEDGTRMIAYDGKDGTVLWDIERYYSNPPILHGDKIITRSTMYSLLTGGQIRTTNPLTGNTMPWRYERTYGCGYHIACENLLTFRSSAAAYYDLLTDGGTGHFGGLKSSCSPNLIAADGILNAPEYTRTCICSYQNQTSLALIHMPDVEVWTTFQKLEIDGPIQRVGINLGASGDRRAEDGALWLEYPVVGGASPDIEIAITPETPKWFLRHASQMEDEERRWVGASGAEGISSVRLGLSQRAHAERSYLVRLYFAEPQNIGDRDRIFNVALQGRTVLEDFDIAKEAGGPMKTVVKEFGGIKVKDDLVVALTPSPQMGPATVGPVLCGVEVALEAE